MAIFSTNDRSVRRRLPPGPAAHLGRCDVYGRGWRTHRHTRGFRRRQIDVAAFAGGTGCAVRWRNPHCRPAGQCAGTRRLLDAAARALPPVGDDRGQCPCLACACRARSRAMKSVPAAALSICSNGWVWLAAPAPSPSNSRAANSSVWPWPGRSRHHRKCCCSTNPFRRSIRKHGPPLRLDVLRMIEATATTLVLVTHDAADAALLCHRALELEGARTATIVGDRSQLASPAVRNAQPFGSHAA